MCHIIPLVRKGGRIYVYRLHMNEQHHSKKRNECKQTHSSFFSQYYLVIFAIPALFLAINSWLSVSVRMIYI